MVARRKKAQVVNCSCGSLTSCLGGKTVSGVFLVDLSALMATLNDTDPHFVRQVQALDSMTVPTQ